MAAPSVATVRRCTPCQRAYSGACHTELTAHVEDDRDKNLRLHPRHSLAFDMKNSTATEQHRPQENALIAALSVAGCERLAKDLELVPLSIRPGPI